MSAKNDKRNKFLVGVAIVVGVALVGQWLGLWELSAFVPMGGPEGGQ